MHASLNICISGGTGTGKTTFLTALTSEIDEGERVITVEDTPELQLPHLPDWVPKVLRRGQSIRFCIEFDHSDLFAHFMQFECDAIAEMSQPYEDYVFVQCGCYCHFPFLTARAAIEKQASEICQSLREHNNPNEGHEKVK